MELIQSVDFDFPILMISSSDHVTGKTGAVLTISLSKAGAPFQLITPVVTEIGFGQYSAKLLGATHIDTLGSFSIHAEAAGCDPFDSLDQVISAAQAAIPVLPSSSLLTQLKVLLEIDESDTSQDVQLVQLLEFATTVVQGVTKRYFGQPHAHTEYHRVDGRRSFILDGYIDDSPAANLNPDPSLNPSTSLTISRREIGASGDWEVLVENEDWERRGRKILAMMPLLMTWTACDEYRCQYLDGYADAPADIDRVILEIAANQVINDAATASGSLGVTSEKLGDFSYSLDGASVGGVVDLLSSFGKSTLERYRRRLV